MRRIGAHANLLPAAAAVLLMLGGCTSSGTFPSLAPRAVEGLASQPERETGAPVRALDAALETEVAAIAARVAAGEREWQASLAEARLIVGRARGQAIGSEPGCSRSRRSAGSMRRARR
jgi:hypothetical protein